MAKRNYLVDGVSGAGKSSVYDELIERGYKAVSTDRAWKVEVRGREAAIWDERKAIGELELEEPDVLFVCGGSGNRDRFLPYFTKIFTLRIDDDTLRRRLAERTNNDFGKEPQELELTLALNRSGEKPPGAVDIDATRPLQQVVDDILRLADCAPARSDSELAPWSKRGSAAARSLVIPESALAGAADSLERESISRIEYSWSGSVLVALLSYLRGQGIRGLGIDLAHPGHEHAGWVFVLTPDHRERYAGRLDPIAFDGAALRRYYEELNETAAAGVEYAMLDGIAFLRDTLAPLESGLVAVVLIR